MSRRSSSIKRSRFYRANLIMDGRRLVFRDIHKMCDGFEEPFLDKVCTGWQALYFTPPVVDQWMFRGKGISIVDGGVNFVFQGFRYRVPVRGEVKATAKGFIISGDRIEPAQFVK